MQLPPSLREAIDRELEGIALADLERAAEVLSNRYRAETRDGRFHVDDVLAARAYLATRLPATYAATARALQATTEARPGFAPHRMLDVGAGPGTASWAAVEQWPSIQRTQLIEGSTAMCAVGGRLASRLRIRADWRMEPIDTALSHLLAHDLVVMSYVLDELEPAARDRLIMKLWELSADVLLIIEPGTSPGWQRILRAREQLIAAGAHLLAPCPHAGPCPLIAPDWCHFSVRVARSRLHREAKGGTVPWEDEKFIYLAVSRQCGLRTEARIVGPPRIGKAGVALKLCRNDGNASNQTISKRSGLEFKYARKLEWGDSFILRS
ncbi:MAG: small ribosomal subunit Rsm22 family protein [Dongiaceae bacterium]